MTAPLVEPSDLATWLGQDEEDFDAPRAALVIRSAQNLVATYLNAPFGPIVPAPVIDVILEVAARIYVNPAGLTTENSGPFMTIYAGDGALKGTAYLTEVEKATLDRLRPKRAKFFTLQIDNKVG